MTPNALLAIGRGNDRFAVGTGSIGPIYLGGHEIVRRIFVTLRNSRWQEVTPSEWRVERHSALSVSIEARHVGPDIDFSWEGTFHLAPSATSLAFTFEGEAHRDMEVCRLGLVLLCPTSLASGAKLVLGAPGRAQTLQLPRELGPQQIREGLPCGLTEPFNSLVVEAADGRRAELRFSGDLFEVEDQRNWGDASYKIYCTPLRLGFPRPVAKGSRLAHRVEVQVRTPPWLEAPHPAVDLLDADPSPLPRLLVSAGNVLASPAPWPVAAVDLDEPGARDDLRRLRAIAPNTRIDLGLTAQDLRGPATATLLGELGSALDRVRLSGEGPELPSPADLARLRDMLSGAGLASTPVLAATRGYFVEFNRGVPFDLDVDGIAFPVSPTVHGEDLRTAFENGAVVADMVRAGRRLTGCERVAVAPLDWRFPAVPDGSPAPPRAVGLWALSALLNAVQAGAESICLGRDAVAGLESLAGRPASTLSGALESARRLPLQMKDELVSLAALAWPDGRTLLVAANLSDNDVRLALPTGFRLAGEGGTDRLAIPARDYVAVQLVRQSETVDAGGAP